MKQTITHHQLYNVYKAFHHYSDVHFFRKEDGSVTIMKLIGETKDGTSSHGWPVYEIEWEHTVDPDSWASIICSVSGKGETSENYQTIKKFHS